MPSTVCLKCHMLIIWSPLPLARGDASRGTLKTYSSHLHWRLLKSAQVGNSCSPRTCLSDARGLRTTCPPQAAGRAISTHRFAAKSCFTAHLPMQSPTNGVGGLCPDPASKWTTYRRTRAIYLHRDFSELREVFFSKSEFCVL